ncbi:DUF953 domain protein [Pseudomassariella vexata]|uniref:DUF953 domain protein n=1 Tax=Pseudomassariella vexata TaxID=1141098 RepID=A0A1Y2D9J8_9PEZI|nr:DUF953 domain protein [Pseudomassariella vexata]ORY55844.1 DUF953 domain protein [Pseudomassariella vexata]
MPVLTNFTLPSSPTFVSLPYPTKADGPQPKARLYIAFMASVDPVTRQPWCPDVRAALPVIQAAFSEGGHTPDEEVALVEVGQKDEWREPRNEFRNTWNISNVPTLVRFERMDGQVKETGRLVEGEILDDKKLKAFIGR